MSKILVIEDQQLILENTLEILELEGFETIEADNGAVGLQMIRGHSPDLIFAIS